MNVCVPWSEKDYFSLVIITCTIFCALHESVGGLLLLMALMIDSPYYKPKVSTVKFIFLPAYEPC